MTLGNSGWLRTHLLVDSWHFLRHCSCPITFCWCCCVYGTHRHPYPTNYYPRPNSHDRYCYVYGWNQQKALLKGDQRFLINNSNDHHHHFLIFPLVFTLHFFYSVKQTRCWLFFVWELWVLQGSPIPHRQRMNYHHFFLFEGFSLVSLDQFLSEL